MVRVVLKLRKFQDLGRLKVSVSVPVSRSQQIKCLGQCSCVQDLGRINVQVSVRSCVQDLNRLNVQVSVPVSDLGRLNVQVSVPVSQILTDCLGQCSCFQDLDRLFRLVFLCPRPWQIKCLGQCSCVQHLGRINVQVSVSVSKTLTD